MVVGRALRASRDKTLRRVARGLTQEKHAELLDVNPRTIQKIEARKLNILLTTILRLQSALANSWNSLMRRYSVFVEND